MQIFVEHDTKRILVVFIIVRKNENSLNIF
jgi:hypothetical protein